MGNYAHAFGPDRPEVTYIPHEFAEQLVDLGEVQLNYVTAGSADRPALLLIPGQTESWWGYEQAIPLLAEHFQIFAVDLRGQGRSSRTPGRYTLDNMGNDLVRFIDRVIGRPTFVSGLSSGGVLSCWLSAYALPGQVRGAIYEDPPLFSSERTPRFGPPIQQSLGPLFAMFSKFLGDQWSIGDWDGMVANLATEVPGWIAGVFAKNMGPEPSQTLKEYDPEWGRVFWEGTVGASCDHARMLSTVKVPVLLTHHFRMVDDATGSLLGALGDLAAKQAIELVTAAGQTADYQSFPAMGHSMHSQDPQLFAETVVEWVTSQLA
jgi:pimeloyl-ACP methyl ester carboxylesterase